MNRKGKRIELWLEEDHPIFSYPAGSRSAVIRNMLNQGLMFEQILCEINELKDKLDTRMVNQTDKENLSSTQETRVSIDDFIDI